MVKTTNMHCSIWDYIFDVADTISQETGSGVFAQWRTLLQLLDVGDFFCLQIVSPPFDLLTYWLLLLLLLLLACTCSSKQLNSCIKCYYVRILRHRLLLPTRFSTPTWVSPMREKETVFIWPSVAQLQTQIALNRQMWRSTKSGRRPLSYSTETFLLVLLVGQLWWQS